MHSQRDTPENYLYVGDAYSQSQDFVRAIRAYKRALELYPEPELEMLLCWNCALAVWFRAGFVNREDTNTTDSEYEEVLAARTLYRRMLMIYETNFRDRSESNGLPVGELYQYAKDNLVDSRRYCMVSRLPDGTFIPRIIDPNWFHLEDWFQKQ